MPMSIKEKYAKYVTILQRVQDFKNAIALLHWDNEVQAPPKGKSFRGRQIATLSAAAHELFAGEELGQLLEELYQQRQQLSPDERKNIEITLDTYQREKRLPIDFVHVFSTARSKALQAWSKARKANDYTLFKEALQVMVNLFQQKAELLGYEEHPYDALVNEFEAGMTVRHLDVLFGEVREQLVTFTKEIREKGQPSSKDFLSFHYDKQQQERFSIELLEQMGFDFEAGCQSFSEHPFTAAFSPRDVRVTTHIETDNPLEMIGGAVHEGGHALYELGLNPEFYGLPLGTGTSIGIHESQSRLWENQVGLSRAYWQANFARMKELFPQALKRINLEQFYKAINQVGPNQIRTTADELHYHLHILIRYEIEKGLLDGSYQVNNLEEIWNVKYKDFLGLEVSSPLQGILQDIHWAEGLFGYFPTYSLGSFYAAQFFHAAQHKIPDLLQQIAKGNMQPLLQWLRHHIHQHGKRYTSDELCQRITGERLNLKYFMNYAKRKYAAIYDLNAELLEYA